MRQALLILNEDEDEREQEPFSFGKKCPGLWLHLPPVFNDEGVIRLGKSGNCNSLLGTLFEPPDPFIHNCLAHFYFVIFTMTTRKIFSILHSIAYMFLKPQLFT